MPFSSLTLKRYPRKHHAALQAFNAAEALVCKRITEEFSNHSLSLVNEEFGAISCLLHRQVVDFYNDSKLALLARQQNLEANQLTINSGNTNLPDLQGEVIVLAIPKSSHFFAWQLAKLALLNRPILAYGMVKHISKSHIALMQDYFQQAHPSRAEKKARTILLSKGNSDCKVVKASSYFVPESAIELENLPGVFAQNQIDIGARFFVSQFHQLPKANMLADVGCGNGILGISYAKLLEAQSQSLHIDFIDQSKQAVDSCQRNIHLNQLNINNRCLHNDGLLSIDRRYDLILCNPPFHQDHTVSIDIALALFEQMRRALAVNGECWIVANAHLPYSKPLKKLFNTVQVAGKNHKFLLYRCLS